MKDYRLKRFKPVFTGVLVTMDVYEEDVYTGNIITTDKTKGQLKPFQQVIEVGDTVRNCKIGDTVLLDLTRFRVPVHDANSVQTLEMKPSDNLKMQYDLSNVTYTVDGRECMLLQDRDIAAVIEIEEVDVPEPAIVLPSGKKIII